MSKFLHFFRDNDDHEIKISFYDTVNEWTTTACPEFFSICGGDRRAED